MVVKKKNAAEKTMTFEEKKQQMDKDIQRIRDLKVTNGVLIMAVTRDIHDRVEVMNNRVQLEMQEEVEKEAVMIAKTYAALTQVIESLEKSALFREVIKPMAQEMITDTKDKIKDRKEHEKYCGCSND